MFEVNDEASMTRALEMMSPDEREHLRVVISELIQCYLDKDLHGMVFVGKEPYSVFKLMMVNTNEMDASQMVSAASSYIGMTLMEDAPPKEQFN